MRWARERAIALDPLGPDIALERLAPLDELLSGKRIVFLGEFEHFVHEKYDYRLLFLRYLDSGAQGRGRSRTLNALLPRVGPAYVLPTASREPGARALTRRRKLAITSGQRVRLVLSQQADVLCFVREVSPLRSQ